MGVQIPPFAPIARFQIFEKALPLKSPYFPFLSSSFVMKYFCLNSANVEFTEDLPMQVGIW